jgi:hypothetical protein
LFFSTQLYHIGFGGERWNLTIVFWGGAGIMGGKLDSINAKQVTVHGVGLSQRRKDRRDGTKGVNINEEMRTWCY